MKNLVTRTLTGLVYVVLLAGSTIYSPVTAFFFFGIVAAATLFEFGTVMNNHAGSCCLAVLYWKHLGIPYDSPLGSALIIYNGKRVVQA